MRYRLPPLVMLAGLAFAAPAHAHFGMLLPQSPSAKRGEAVTFVYQWGHPFEHQLSDAPAPQSLVVLGPDGRETDLTKTLEKTALPAGGKKAVAYRFPFKPEQRGDYTFILSTPPAWSADEEEFVQDVVRVVLHVQAQNGWDAARKNGPAFEVVPLTRPYGLQPGMVFQALATRAATGPSSDREPVAGALVEIERYNSAPPKTLPPDEHITRAAKTDPKGVVTCTLTEPGWWGITVQGTGGKQRREGKDYPVRQRYTLWVFVDEKPAAK